MPSRSKASVLLLPQLSVDRAVLQDYVPLSRAHTYAADKEEEGLARQEQKTQGSAEGAL